VEPAFEPRLLTTPLGKHPILSGGMNIQAEGTAKAKAQRQSNNLRKRTEAVGQTQQQGKRV
jgi:hypothetical protein